jgi:hypothetical protein
MRRAASVAGVGAVLVLVACSDGGPAALGWRCSGVVVCGDQRSPMAPADGCAPRAESQSDVTARVGAACTRGAASACPGAACLLLCERAPALDGACSADAGAP